MTSPASSRSGMRLTTKVPALLVSRSIRIGLPVASTWCICVFCTTLETGWPTKSSSRSKPSAGRKRRYWSLIQTTRALRSTSIMPSLAVANRSNMDRAASSRMLCASRGSRSSRVMRPYYAQPRARSARRSALSLLPAVRALAAARAPAAPIQSARRASPARSPRRCCAACRRGTPAPGPAGPDVARRSGRSPDRV